jgi:hypothetical protein
MSEVLALATAGLILLIGVRIAKHGLTLRKKPDGSVTVELEDDPTTPPSVPEKPDK